MAKFKLTLGALPDFKLPVKFTMPNGEEAKIVFTVKHVKANEIQDLYASENAISDVEMITKLAVGWDLEEEFNEENVKELISYFPASALALTGTYLAALAGQRVKN